MRRPLSAKLAFVFAAGLFVLLGCAPPAVPRGRLAADIDAACGGSAWRQRQALAADLTIRREGHPDLRGSLLYDTRRDRLVIEFLSSRGGMNSFGFDGSTLWADGPDDRRFVDWVKLLQWARWVAVPYRLTDSAFRVREVQPLVLAAGNYRVAEIQRPADGPALCALFIDPGTLRPRGAVPVLSADLPTGAVAPAYGLAYEQFSLFQDVAVPTRWSVWDWNARTGIGTHGPVAKVKLDHPRFVEPDPAQFAPPRPESTLPFTSAQTGIRVCTSRRWPVPTHRHNGLNGFLRTARSVAAALIALLLAAGCAAQPQMPRPASVAPFGRNVTLIYVTGIGGRGQEDRSFVRGLSAGGYVGDAEVVDWTGQLGPIAALWAHARQQAEAHRIAQRIGKIRSESPQVPIVLVGHSAGAAVAVAALEDLPPGASVDELMLLAPALSRTYDLTAALRHVRGCADVFNSDRDTLVLAFGTLLFGTADSIHGEAAGHGGFVRPPGAGHAAYSKLHAHAYSRDRQQAGDDGGHEGTLTSGVAAAVIAPLLPGHELHHASRREPLAQSDAHQLP